MQQDILENRHNLDNNHDPKYHQPANRRLRNNQNHSFRWDRKAQDISEFYNIQTECQDQKCSTKDLEKNFNLENKINFYLSDLHQDSGNSLLDFCISSVDA